MWNPKQADIGNKASRIVQHGKEYNGVRDLSPNTSERSSEIGMCDRKVVRGWFRFSECLNPGLCENSPVSFYSTSRLGSAACPDVCEPF